MMLRQYWNRLAQPVMLVVAVLLVFLVGWLDLLTGREASLSIFYLLPIFWVSWSGNRRLGVLIAAISAVTGLEADFLTDSTDSLVPYWNASARLSVYLVNAYLISELRNRLRYEATLARTDTLTSAANSRCFYDLAAQEIERARRTGRPFTVAYMDLDNFKTVNDRFGHNTGDELLCLVANTAQEGLRKTDVFARLGGDEFAILMPETTSAPAQQVLQRLRHLLLNAMRDREWPVTFSMGAVTFIEPPASVDEMVQRADALMYAGKQEGKDVIRYEVVGTAPLVPVVPADADEVRLL